MKADFDIIVHKESGDFTVRVVVHDSVRALRSASTQQAKRWKDKDLSSEGLLGVCHRFHIQKSDGTKDPLCAVVRLAPPNLGIGLVAHELAHATVWIQEIDHQFKDVPLTCENDEEFCWVLGELVRQTVNQFYKRGVYS